MIEAAGIAVVALVALASVGLLARSRRRREETDTRSLANAVLQNLHIPATLHPVIDPDLCIGSLSCLSACPEGDILGLVDGKAVLIEAAACIGHGKCALECPVDAIKLVFGTAHRGQDLPEVDEYFETSRPGIHIAGELGGMGLIRNAVSQGLDVAAHLAARLKKGSRSSAGAVDVAIVGAGPAGLAAALGLKKAGLSFRVLEQDSLGGTIAHYPRQKVVMTEPAVLPYYGKLGKKLISKEELLEAWQEAIRKADVTITEGVQVTGITGDDGNFSVQTTKGALAARKVVLATGRRGTPRKMGVPGEELEKVAYRLIDPDQYVGAKVLVVGGGDSALEAAIQLGEESDAQVTLSYRNEAFGKCREANKRKFAEMVQRGRVRALMGSQVREVRQKEVVIESNGKKAALRNDFIIVCIGGELPTEFLSKAGVGMQRHFGTAPGASFEGDEVSLRTGNARELADRRKQRRLALALTAVGAVVIAVLAVVGAKYYPMSRVERLKSPLHAFLRSSGPWGHGVGIVATAFMLLNFLYPIRKRWQRLKGAGPIRRWLTFHQFVGFMSPLVIAFHAAFQSNNFVATATSVSLVIVVLTGIFGRFVFGLVPTHDGRTTELAEVVSRWERLKTRIDPLLAGVTDVAAVKAILSRATAAPSGGSLVGLLGRMPFEYQRTRGQLRQIRALFPSREHYREFTRAFWKLDRLRTQVGFYRSLKRLLSVWRLFHAVLAVVLVVMISAHIGVSIFLGYKWIFS